MILEKLIDQLDSSSDLADEERDLSAEASALSLTLNASSHGSQRFEVNQFHNGDADSWSYELHEVDPVSNENNYLDVRIPDASPEDGPFIPLPFLDAVRAAGDIVAPTGDELPLAD
jgi:hypothetical protein